MIDRKQLIEGALVRKGEREFSVSHKRLDGAVLFPMVKGGVWFYSYTELDPVEISPETMSMLPLIFNEEETVYEPSRCPGWLMLYFDPMTGEQGVIHAVVDGSIIAKLEYIHEVQALLFGLQLPHRLSPIDPKK